MLAYVFGLLKCYSQILPIRRWAKLEIEPSPKLSTMLMSQT